VTVADLEVRDAQGAVHRDVHRHGQDHEIHPQACDTARRA
jgi:hypothetical protein